MDGEKKTQLFTCPNCGSGMEFNPQSGQLKCTHCDYAGAMPEQVETRIEESDFLSTLNQLEQNEAIAERLTVTCDNCAAVLEFDPNITADRCIYCGSAINAQKQSKRLLQPRYLLPFAITGDQAANNFRKWLKGRWFMPGAVLQKAAMAKMDGVYSPFWTYDADTFTNYTGMRGDYYYVQESYTTTDSKGNSVTKTRTVRRTRWSYAAGTVSNRFDDILCLGSKSLPRHYTEALEPWDLNNLSESDPSYTSGFRVECYSIDLKEGFTDAREQMQPVIDRTIRGDIGGDEQRITTRNVDYHDITFKYILLPIWISAFRFKDKTYRFVVNARTGEVQGERPWSVIKIIMFILMLLAIAAGIWFLIDKYSR